MRVLRWILVLCGIALFAYSFTLPAVKEANAAATATGMIGYKCATLTLLVPWGKDGFQMLRDSPLQYVSILLSGWINPVFLIALVLAMIRPRLRASLTLSMVTTAMFVFCWIVFSQLKLHPMAGYWMWMAGILLALYSNLLAAK